MADLPVPDAEHACLSHHRRDSAGWLMKCILMHMRTAVDRRMELMGLTDAQWAPVLHLAAGDARTAAELSRTCMQSPGGMTRMLDRLAAKGFVERLRSADDRRVVNLILTPQGLHAAEGVPAALAEVNELALADLTPPEAAQFKGYLQRVLATLERSAPPEPAPNADAAAQPGRSPG